MTGINKSISYEQIVSKISLLCVLFGLYYVIVKKASPVCSLNTNPIVIFDYENAFVP